MNNLIAGISLTAIIGAAAFLVSVIVEVTKELPGIRNIFTQMWVIAVSLIVCLAGYFVYISIAGLPILAWQIVAVVIASFVVAYVSMYGWDTAKELLDRFKE